MVNYKLGNYKKGFLYAQEATFKIKRENAKYNNTYALLATKILPTRKYIPQLEQFVKDGRATPEIIKILKEVYLKKHSKTGYEDYIASLERAGQLK